MSQIISDDYGRLYAHSEPASRRWQPMKKVGHQHDYDIYENDAYYCSVRRFAKGFFLKNSPYIILGITATDETARHDWRDFQRIKNDIAGREWEGIELYPAESRLKDPSNRFYLWCVPKGVLKFGLPGGRHVLTSSNADAPQRPFDEESP